jgi:hypothetical protein
MDWMRASLGSILVAGLALAGPAAAENPKEIGSFGSWRAMTFDEEGKRGCYIISLPQRMEGAYKSRGDVYALVTHRPEEQSFGVVSVVAGYTYKDASEVTVDIDGQVFSLFTNKNMAWAFDENDAELVAAMKKGAGMLIRGMSSRGTETMDTYSLKGFTRAYKAIAEACNAPQ